ncbi:MAG: hypothetical protein ACI37Q_07375 [Candidatus Gastranaerophilaceae bacterium]
MAGISISQINSISRATTQRVVSAMPEMTVNSEKANKFIGWVGDTLTSPHNRLILGVTALMTQPFIDLNNKKVDEETRKVSAARTVAKIIAGTVTGVIIRAGCIKAINSFTKLPHEITPDIKFKKLRQLFTPSPGILDDLKKYKDSLGTILSVGIMVFTNFLIDAPFTKYLTNKFIDKIKQREKQQGQVQKTAQNTTQIKEAQHE